MHTKQAAASRVCSDIYTYDQAMKNDLLDCIEQKAPYLCICTRLNSTHIH